MFYIIEKNLKSIGDQSLWGYNFFSMEKVVKENLTQDWLAYED